VLLIGFAIGKSEDIPDAINKVSVLKKALVWSVGLSDVWCGLGTEGGVTHGLCQA